jgi:YHS domain-containing protein
MTWVYENTEYQPTEMDHKKIYGFVYIIENTKTSKKYVGKKFFFASKTRQVNKKKKRYKAESDWQTYYGSSESLLADVALHGKESFSRTILHLCATKAECGYLEAREQFERNVLLSDNYYNSWISVRVRQAHLKGLQIQETVL